MTPETYLQSVKADADLVLQAAQRDPAAAIPSCPGWSERDLLTHLATVYRHKVECIRLGRNPTPWPPAVPDDRPAYFTAALAELVAELSAHDIAHPSYTWYPPDQTVGFWYRRMALETAVHRVDAQLAFGDADPVEESLAVDGIDEILVVMLSGDWSDEPQAGPAAAVRVEAGGHTWRVVLDETSVTVRPDSREPVAATLTGPASDVLLWLWGRSEAGVEATGDSAAVKRLRHQLVLATQ